VRKSYPLNIYILFYLGRWSRILHLLVGAPRNLPSLYDRANAETQCNIMIARVRQWCGSTTQRILSAPSTHNLQRTNERIKQNIHSSPLYNANDRAHPHRGGLTNHSVYKRRSFYSALRPSSTIGGPAHAMTLREKRLQSDAPLTALESRSYR
jgi:hypothetical protein